MQVATWVIQEQQRVVQHVARRLAKRATASPEELTALLDVVYRALVARLSGGLLHEGTVRELRERFGPARLAGAAHALAAELRDVAGARSKDEATVAGDRKAISDAVDDVVAALDPEDAVPVDMDDGPRPTLVTAMSELAARPLTSTEAPRPPRALLRVRAGSGAAARALRARREDATRGGGVRVESSAADELILSTAKDGAEGVTHLVRAATALFDTDATATAQLSAALVAVDGDPLDAAVAAAALLQPSLLRFDERSWAAIEGHAAPAPQAPRSVDPRAPFSTDRLEQSALLMRPTLCGRDEEVAALAQWLLAPTPRAGLMVLHGAAGMGKSSLVRAALSEAGYDDHDAPLLWGSADAVLPTPYAALVAMLRGAANAPAGSPVAQTRVDALVGRLAEHVPAEQRPELPQAAQALTLLLGEAAAQSDLGPRALRYALRRAWVLLVRALWERAGAARPVVMVVGGADKIDGPTRELLELCAAQLTGRLRVVLTTAQKPRLAPSLEGVFDTRRMTLAGLSDAAAAELAGQMLGGLAGDGLAALFARAKGNPLAISQAVRLVVELGWVRPGDEAPHLPPSRELPGRLERVLLTRVERLPTEQRRLLTACAFLGVGFSVEAAELMGVRLGLGHDDVHHALTVLSDTGFLVREQPRPARPLFADARDPQDAAPYAFEHPLLRAAAESSCDDHARASMHTVAADALETVSAAESSAAAAGIARHLALAGEVPRARDLLLAATRRAAHLDDRHGAIAFAREGLQLCGEDGALAFAFHKEVCRVRSNGPRKAHVQALEELARSAAQSHDPRRRAEALTAAARFNLRRGDPALAGSLCQQALTELRGLGDAPLELSVLRVLLAARAAQADLEAVRALVAELEVRLPQTDRRARAAVAWAEGTALFAADALEPALERLLQALLHARASADPLAVADCLEALARVYGASDRPDVALALLDKAQRGMDSVGDTIGGARLATVRAELLLGAGDEEQALHAAAAARQAADAIHDEAGDAAAQLVQARAHLVRGDAFLAEPILDALRKKSRDPLLRAAAAAAMARAKVLRAVGTAGAARERLLKTALARAKEALAAVEGMMGAVPVRMQASAAMADALLVEGDADGAFPHAQHAVELVQDAPSGPWIEEALLASARVAAAMSDSDELNETLELARGHLMRRAARLDEATRARFWLVPGRAELLRSSDEKTEAA